MNEIKCGHCGSPDVQKASVIYDGGTSTGSSMSAGSVGGRTALMSTSSSSQTNLAKKLSPPPRMGIAAMIGFGILTQNVDDLHERAGAERVLHMHGEHLNAWCTACDTRTRWTGALLHRPPCPACGTPALRPDVVWFGEMPYRMDEIYAALRAADLFVSIGTSGAVYPAAGFVQNARDLGARTLELNLEPSQGSSWFHETRLGAATEIVPQWVDEVLSA